MGGEGEWERNGEGLDEVRLVEGQEKYGKDVMEMGESGGSKLRVWFVEVK